MEQEKPQNEAMVAQRLMRMLYYVFFFATVFLISFLFFWWLLVFSLLAPAAVMAMLVTAVLFIPAAVWWYRARRSRVATEPKKKAFILELKCMVTVTVFLFWGSAYMLLSEIYFLHRHHSDIRSSHGPCPNCGMG